MFLKSLTWNFVLNSQGILVWGAFVQGFMSRGLCLGVYILIPRHSDVIFNLLLRTNLTPGINPLSMISSLQVQDHSDFGDSKLWVLGRNHVSRNCVLCMHIRVAQLQVIYVEHLYSCEWHFCVTVEYEAARFTDIFVQRALQNVYRSIQNLIRLWAMCAPKSDMTLGNMHHEIWRNFGQHASRN